MAQSENEENGGRQIRGSLVEGHVVISRREDVDSLSEGGYGIKKGDSTLQLNGCEALYLAAEKRLRVADDGEELSFQNLLRVSQQSDAAAWSEFLLYRDLRERGYVVRKGPVSEVGFRVYERGAYPKKAAKYIVLLLRDGSPTTVDHLWNAMKLAQGMKKKLILAVMDRRGEIVYYSLDQFNPT